MEALLANGVIREWARTKVEDLALAEDTARFNLLIAIVDRMALRVGQGGDSESLHADLHDFLFQEVPLQLDPHATAIKRLQDGFDELCSLIEQGGAAAPQEGAPPVAAEKEE